MHQSLVFKKNLTESDFEQNDNTLTAWTWSSPESHESQQYFDVELEEERLDDIRESWSYNPLKTQKSPNQSDVDDKSAGCNHEEYKESRVIPKSAGGSIMGNGINAGTGKIVIVCTKCHTYYDAKGASSSDDA